MKEMHKKLFAAAALASVMFAGTSLVQAGPPNSANGYSSVHDNIMDKGANYGRCNALGVLAGKVCETESTLIPGITTDMLNTCGGLGVNLAEDPAAALCIEIDIGCQDTNPPTC